MTDLKRAVLVLLSLSVPAAAYAQGPTPKRSDARAEARAEARSDGGSSKTHSVTHRVVVVNGKTIVDERTENGRPVGGGARRGAGRRPAPMPMPKLEDPQEILRRMKRQLERELGRELPLGGFDEPLPGSTRKQSSRRSSKGSKSTSRKSARGSSPKGKPATRRDRLEPRRRLR